MRAAVVEKPGALVVREVPEVAIDETECLVEILACALCNSTDLKLLEGHFRNRGPEMYPAILGHESVGRVVRCGSQVRSYREGDLVLRAGASYPSGEGPSSLFGGLAQFGKVKDPVHGGSPAHQVVPPETDPLDATMLITLKETLSWLQRWPVAAGQSLVVMGSGPVGLAFGYFARLLGCAPVVVLGRREAPLAKALELGAADAVVSTADGDTEARVREVLGGGADRVIDAVGDDRLVELGFRLLDSGGRLGLYGISASRTPGDMERRALDIPMGRLEWSLDSFAPREAEAHEEVLQLVRKGELRLRDWYTHVVPLEETRSGFELLRRKEAFKVVVKT
ncbi:MAG: zinc-binding dehydrogenase [Armatimonadetes bacterium]|nr:zinc-binding dehydrogenase [Armatimonadota bacterium]NPV49273.1 zinc-binding dehydrogenase [Armatimonadota bacterium]